MEGNIGHGDCFHSWYMNFPGVGNGFCNDPWINVDDDAIDFGFYGTYEDSAGTPEYSGIVRDASSGDGEWIFFDSLTTEPGATTTVGANYFAYAAIKCAVITGVDDDGSGNAELTGFNIDGGSF